MKRNSEYLGSENASQYLTGVGDAGSRSGISRLWEVRLSLRLP